MSERYVLYQYASCPFCARVNRFLQEFDPEQLKLQIETRDTLRDPHARRELVEGGGRASVPCLRIESGAGVQWLYESMDIMQFLHARLEGSVSNA